MDVVSRMVDLILDIPTSNSDNVRKAPRQASHKGLQMFCWGFQPIYPTKPVAAHPD